MTHLVTFDTLCQKIVPICLLLIQKKLLIHVWTVIEKLTGHTDLKNQTLLMHGHSYLDKYYIYKVIWKNTTHIYIYGYARSFGQMYPFHLLDIYLWKWVCTSCPGRQCAFIGFSSIHSFTQIVVNISNGAKVIYQVKYF